MTAHKSKGLEADNVILLNFQNSTLGFPNKIADDPVLALVLAEPEDFLYAEERRLLYVALTRTKNRVFVLTDSQKPSEFFKEFKPSKSVFILNKETDIADLPCCPKCRTGHLLSRRNERTGKFFVGCSNYPKCDYVVRDVTVLTEQKYAHNAVDFWFAAGDSMASSTVVRIIRGAATQSRFLSKRKQEIDTEPIKRLTVLSSTTSARLWRKRSKRSSIPNLRLLTG